MKVWVATTEGDSFHGLWHDLEDAKKQEMDRCFKVTDAMYGDRVHYRQWQCYQGDKWDLYYRFENDYGKHSVCWVSLEEYEVK